MALHANESKKNQARGLIVALLITFFAPVAFTPSYSSPSAPAVTSLSKTSGSAAVDTAIEIYGTGLADLDVSGSPVVADVFLESTTLSVAVSMSFTVSSHTTISATISPLAQSSRSNSVYSVVVVFSDGTASRLNYQFIQPTLTSVTPTNGSASGGTAITLSGTGFYDGGLSSGVTALKIGDEVITDFTVVSDTQITATLSARTGTGRTVGSKDFTLVTGLTASGIVSFNFVPVRDGSNTFARSVFLGDLASRSKGQAIVRSTTSPYFVDGTDSLTLQPYRYRTNAPYTHNPNSLAEKSAYGRESTEALPDSFTSTVTTQSGISVAGKSDELIKMVQTSECNNHNNARGGGVFSFCSTFGPEFYTEAFYAEAGQNLSFEWYAVGNQDDYEFYAFLVSVSNTSTIPAASSSNHTIAAHGMGYRRGDNFWETSTATIPSDGLYRFRFVNGSYDGTGGKVLGSTVYVRALFSAGLSNTIAFGPIADQVGTGDSFAASARSSSSAEVTITSATPSTCTVATSHAAPTTTVTITKVATGTCTLNASQGSSGGYAAAETKVVTFQITAPPAPNLAAYSPASYSLTAGTAATINSPTNSGGTILVWSVSPGLPAGMTLNTSTGAISGTPTTVQAFILYSVKASNGTGTSSATISIEVLPSAVAPTEAPKPGSYTGPSPTLFIPRVLPENTAQTVRVIGERLNLITGMSHQGVALSFTIISSGEIEVRIPALPVGIKEIRFDYRPGGIVNFMNALEVTRVTQANNPTSSPITEPSVPSTLSPVRKAVVWGFVPGLTRLDSSGVRILRAVTSRLASAKEISCIGYTMGPTVLARDIQLSYDRATTICNRLKASIPGVKILRLEGRQDSRQGERIRRVEIEWRN